MWSDIRDIINDTYKGDFDEQSYKYEFFKNITDFFADRTAVDFLEIGSYQGVSLVIVAHILRSAGKLVIAHPCGSARVRRIDSVVMRGIPLERRI